MGEPVLEVGTTEELGCVISNGLYVAASLREHQQVALARKFAASVTTGSGERLPYTLAVHHGEGENTHVHLMFSEREEPFGVTTSKHPDDGKAKAPTVCCRSCGEDHAVRPGKAPVGVLTRCARRSSSTVTRPPHIHRAVRQGPIQSANGRDYFQALRRQDM